MACEQPTPVPDSLLEECPSLTEADSPGEMWPVYLQNMEACGVCKARHDGLSDAVKSRQEDK